VGLTVESHRRKFMREFDVRKIESLESFNELYGRYLDGIMRGLLVKTATLSQGKVRGSLQQRCWRREPRKLGLLYKTRFFRSHGNNPSLQTISPSYRFACRSWH